MKPLEQCLRLPNNMRIVNKDPRHFNTTGHIPMKYRTPMFGLTTIDDNSWLMGDRAVLTRPSCQPWSSDTSGLIDTWTASDGAHYALLDAPVPPPSSRTWKPDDAPTIFHHAGAREIEDGDDAGIQSVRSKCAYYIGDVLIKMRHTIITL